jgi:hypothetical protein
MWCCFTCTCVLSVCEGRRGEKRGGEVRLMIYSRGNEAGGVVKWIAEMAMGTGFSESKGR